jgi:hypothetical protein
VIEGEDRHRAGGQPDAGPAREHDCLLRRDRSPVAELQSPEQTEPTGDECHLTGYGRDQQRDRVAGAEADRTQRQQRHEASGDEDACERQREERPQRSRPREARPELVGKLGGECGRVAQVGVRVAAEVVDELGDDPLPAPAADAGTTELRIELGQTLSGASHASTASTVVAKSRHASRRVQARAFPWW